MLLIIILVCSDNLIQPPDEPTALDKGKTDLSRSLIQATAVASYLALLVVVKPYVRSRLRRWKLWVTAANQGTALLLLLARMLAEQAAAQPPAALASANDTTWAAVDVEPQPAIFMASYVFMYIATLCCMAQFVVLCGCFLWSLFEGAKREQVVIVYVAKQKEAARQAAVKREEQSLDNYDGDDVGGLRMVGINMSSNPLRRVSDQGSERFSVSSQSTRSLGDGSVCTDASVTPFDEARARNKSLQFAKLSAQNLSMRRKKSERDQTEREASVKKAALAAQQAEDAAKAAMAAKDSAAKEAAMAAKDSTAKVELAERAAASGRAAAEAEKAAAEAAEAAEAKRWADYEAGAARTGGGGRMGTRMVSHASSNITELEIDMGEEDEWTIHVDTDGTKYWYNVRTGETSWCDVETGKDGGEGQEKEKDKEVVVEDELMVVRSLLRSAMQISEDGTDSLVDQAYLDLVNDTRGDWVEVCDADGSVLGDALAGHTVYFNRSTYETLMSKPPGWVMMQARALSRENSRKRAESVRFKSLRKGSGRGSGRNRLNTGSQSRGKSGSQSSQSRPLGQFL
jgi:hypothetical protein